MNNSLLDLFGQIRPDAVPSCWNSSLLDTLSSVLVKSNLPNRPVDLIALFQTDRRAAEHHVKLRHRSGVARGWRMEDGEWRVTGLPLLRECWLPHKPIENDFYHGFHSFVSLRGFRGAMTLVCETSSSASKRPRAASQKGHQIGLGAVRGPWACGARNDALSSSFKTLCRLLVSSGSG